MATAEYRARVHGCIAFHSRSPYERPWASDSFRAADCPDFRKEKKLRRSDSIVAVNRNLECSVANRFARRASENGTDYLTACCRSATRSCSSAIFSRRSREFLVLNCSALSLVFPARGKATLQAPTNNRQFSKTT